MIDPVNNYNETRKAINYINRVNATPETYRKLGFKCGLEVHQQLKTAKKLFCRCPAGHYQKPEEYNAELLRHMRPTLSELGEYDGTALMEFRTRKNIFYRINDKTACTYDFDDTPPFILNNEALKAAMKIGLMLKSNIVGEIHITRKQYLDGSIPAGFQRTAIVGIEGEIVLRNKTIRIIQLSIEEDSCREISDIGHERIYSTDRLGMPLIETVTYPEMLTPDEAEEACQYIRFLARSSGVVNTGIGGAREDVNVSITGGTRVEIKGVAHINWIPELTHNEAFRQKALLEISKILKDRFPDPSAWKINSLDLTDKIKTEYLPLEDSENGCLKAIRLPGFSGLLSFFLSPGRMFAHELSDRLKVIACLERPNLIHSEELLPLMNSSDIDLINRELKATQDDAWIIIGGPEADMKTALETIEERCLMAFEGVPNETRKSLPNGTTLFERVLPGADRMYPDTDSAPIPISEQLIEAVGKNLPDDVYKFIKQMDEWQIPLDTYTYILSKNLFPLLQQIIMDQKLPPRFAAVLLGQITKHEHGRIKGLQPNFQRLADLVKFVRLRGLQPDILKKAVKYVFANPDLSIENVFLEMQFQPVPEEEILAKIPILKKQFTNISKSKNPAAPTSWIMGQLRPLALGNMNMKHLRQAVEGDLS